MAGRSTGAWRTERARSVARTHVSGTSEVAARTGERSEPHARTVFRKSRALGRPLSAPGGVAASARERLLGSRSPGTVRRRRNGTPGTSSQAERSGYVAESARAAEGFRGLFLRSVLLGQTRFVRSAEGFRGQLIRSVLIGQPPVIKTAEGVRGLLIRTALADRTALGHRSFSPGSASSTPRTLAAPAPAA
jgi:hypothetical protein